jgi:Na+-driven multidrug efflux pump
MGIRGVALATVLGQLLSTILAVIYLCKRLKCVRLTIKSMLPSWEAIGAIATLGFSAFATHILMTTVQIVQMNALRHYGGLSHYGSETAIAAAGAVGKVSIVFFSGIIGIGQGCQPIYGYNIGSRRYDRVKETFLKALRYTLTIAVCAFVIFQIFPNQIMLLFGSDNPLFYEFAARYMRTYLFMMFLHPLQPIVSMFCTSIGKASLGFWMAVIRQGILLIPLLIIFPLLWGIDGFFFSAPVSDAVASVIFAYVGFKQIKMLIRLQKEKESEEAAAAQESGAVASGADSAN